MSISNNNLTEISNVFLSSHIDILFITEKKNVDNE